MIDEARDYALPGHGSDAAVGEGRTHHREVVGGDQQGALSRVDVDDLGGIPEEPTVGGQQIGDPLIAVIGRGFGGEHALVDLEPPPGEAAEPLLHRLPLLCGGRPGHQRGGGEGAGVDHRVHRAAVVELEGDHGVEGEAGVVDPDDPVDLLVTDRLAHQRQHEGLGDGLDREGDVRVPDAVHGAVDLGERKAEERGISLRQHRDVVRHDPGALTRIAGVGLAEEGGDTGLRGEIAGQRALRDIEHIGFEHGCSLSGRRGDQRLRVDGTPRS